MTASRRKFLQGVSLGAGAVVLAPLVRQLEVQAAAPPSVKPARFLFVVEGNGLPWQQIQPAGITRGKNEAARDRLVSQALTKDNKLPKALEPIDAWKSKLTVVQGLSGKVAGGGHSNDFGALGCYHARGGVGNSGAAAAETIDAALGKRLGGVFPQIGLGISDRAEHTVIYNCSAWDKGKAMPTQCRPDLAYASIFGSVAGGSAKKEFVARGNLLDFLSDDLKTLRRETSGSEREKLEQHVAAYESMRQRQSRLAASEESLKKHAPKVTDKYKSAVETDRLEAHFDLAAAALAGGLTNVVTIASGVGNPYFSVKFTGLGINFGKHGIGHGGSYNGMTWEDMSIKIRRFHFEQIARVMKKLESIKEGDGTMLDNTCVVYLSDAAEGHHSRCWEWPMVLIGDLGGRLKAGRYVEYPYWGKKGHKTIGNLYTTLLHAVGDKRTHFNQQDPMLKDLDTKGPLSELLA